MMILMSGGLTIAASAVVFLLITLILVGALSVSYTHLTLPTILLV